GDNTSQRGDTPLERGGSTAHRGDSTHERGNNASQRGDSAHERGNSTSQRGDSTHERGNSTSQRGDSAHERGDYTSYRGNSTHERAIHHKKKSPPNDSYHLVGPILNYLPSCNIVSAMRPRFTSTSSTQTVTTSPTETTSIGCLTKRLANFEIWTSPSCPT